MVALTLVAALQGCCADDTSLFRAAVIEAGPVAGAASGNTSTSKSSGVRATASSSSVGGVEAKEVNYSALRRAVRSVAGVLVDGCELRQGDVVFLLADDSLDFVDVVLGAAWAAVHLVIGNPLLPLKDLVTQMAACRPVAVCLAPRFAALTKVTDRLPSVRGVYLLGPLPAERVPGAQYMVVERERVEPVESPIEPRGKNKDLKVSFLARDAAGNVEASELTHTQLLRLSRSFVFERDSTTFVHSRTLSTSAGMAMFVAVMMARSTSVVLPVLKPSTVARAICATDATTIVLGSGDMKAFVAAKSSLPTCDSICVVMTGPNRLDDALLGPAQQIFPHAKFHVGASYKVDALKRSVSKIAAMRGMAVTAAAAVEQAAAQEAEAKSTETKRAAEAERAAAEERAAFDAKVKEEMARAEDEELAKQAASASSAKGAEAERKAAAERERELEAERLREAVKTSEEREKARKLGLVAQSRALEERMEKRMADVAARPFAADFVPQLADLSSVRVVEPLVDDSGIVPDIPLIGDDEPLPVDDFVLPDVPDFRAWLQERDFLEKRQRSTWAARRRTAKEGLEDDALAAVERYEAVELATWQRASRDRMGLLVEIQQLECKSRLASFDAARKRAYALRQPDKAPGDIGEKMDKLEVIHAGQRAALDATLDEALNKTEDAFHAFVSAEADASAARKARLMNAAERAAKARADQKRAKARTEQQDEERLRELLNSAVVSKTDAVVDVILGDDDGVTAEEMANNQRAVVALRRARDRLVQRVEQSKRRPGGVQDHEDKLAKLNKKHSEIEYQVLTKKEAIDRLERTLYSPREKRASQIAELKEERDALASQLAGLTADVTKRDREAIAISHRLFAQLEREKHLKYLDEHAPIVDEAHAHAIMCEKKATGLQAKIDEATAEREARLVKLAAARTEAQRALAPLEAAVKDLKKQLTALTRGGARQFLDS